MDDFGNTYSMYMSTASCDRWYVSMSAYGGDGWYWMFSHDV